MTPTFDVYLSGQCKARFAHRADAEDYRDALRRRAILAAPDLTEDDINSAITLEIVIDQGLPTR